MNSVLETATATLSQLQRSLIGRNSDDDFFDESEKLLFCPTGDALHVEFYGLTFGSFFKRFMETLRVPAVAASLSDLVFDSPDEGTNGVRDWEFAQFLQSETQFPRLQTLNIVPSTPDQHNITILGKYYEEDGQIARLVALAPDLKHLVVPSAPDATFFQIGSHPLQTLRVESGYDSQNFILNFSQSSNFGQLGALDFGDFNPVYLETQHDARTPFEHYEQLFLSEAFANVRQFTLRNALLSEAQLQHLARLKQDRVFMAIQCSGDYVRP